MHTPWDNNFCMFGCGLRCTWCRSSIAFHRLRSDTLCKGICFHDSVHRASRKDSSTLNAIHRFSGSTVNLWNLVTRNSMFPSCLLANCATKVPAKKSPAPAVSTSSSASSASSFASFASFKDSKAWRTWVEKNGRLPRGETRKNHCDQDPDTKARPRNWAKKKRSPEVESTNQPRNYAA